MMEKADSGLEMIKHVLQTLDKKVDDEIQFRLKSEDEVRQWFTA